MSYYSTNFPPSGNYYDCKHCGKRVWRESEKEWVKSFCDLSDKNVHLVEAKGVNFVDSRKKYGNH